MKRSEAVSLVLLVGASVASVVAAHHDPTQDEEDVRVYPGPTECIAAHLRTEADCRSEYAAALAAYPNAAPRYPTLNACEAHHGADQCVAGAAVTEDARGQYLPLMAGYVVGTAAAQELAAQPIFRHARQDEAASGGEHGFVGYGGYCTGSGARIVPVGGSSAARVSSASLRGGAARGGFGGTGRAFASGGRGGFGG